MFKQQILLHQRGCGNGLTRHVLRQKSRGFPRCCKAGCEGERLRGSWGKSAEGLRLGQFGTHLLARTAAADDGHGYSRQPVAHTPTRKSFHMRSNASHELKMQAWRTAGIPFIPVYEHLLRTPSRYVPLLGISSGRARAAVEIPPDAQQLVGYHQNLIGEREPIGDGNYIIEELGSLLRPFENISRCLIADFCFRYEEEWLGSSGRLIPEPSGNQWRQAPVQVQRCTGTTDADEVFVRLIDRLVK